MALRCDSFKNNGKVRTLLGNEGSGTHASSNMLE